MVESSSVTFTDWTGAGKLVENGEYCSLAEEKQAKVQIKGFEESGGALLCEECREAEAA